MKVDYIVAFAIAVAGCAISLVLCVTSALDGTLLSSYGHFGAVITFLMSVEAAAIFFPRRKSEIALGQVEGSSSEGRRARGLSPKANIAVFAISLLASVMFIVLSVANVPPPDDAPRRSADEYEAFALEACGRKYGADFELVGGRPADERLYDYSRYDDQATFFTLGDGAGTFEAVVWADEGGELHCQDDRQEGEVAESVAAALVPGCDAGALSVSVWGAYPFQSESCDSFEGDVWRCLEANRADDLITIVVLVQEGDMREGDAQAGGARSSWLDAAAAREAADALGGDVQILVGELAEGCSSDVVDESGDVVETLVAEGLNGGASAPNPAEWLPSMARADTFGVFARAGEPQLVSFERDDLVLYGSERFSGLYEPARVADEGWSSSRVVMEAWAYCGSLASPLDGLVYVTADKADEWDAVRAFERPLRGDAATSEVRLSDDAVNGWRVLDLRATGGASGFKIEREKTDQETWSDFVDSALEDARAA